MNGIIAGWGMPPPNTTDHTTTAKKATLEIIDRPQLGGATDGG